MIPRKETAPLCFRASPEEYRIITLNAQEVGMSRSTYIRSRLLQIPQTKPVYQKTETRLLIRHFIGQVGRVGNNMNQIAYKLNCDQRLVSLDRDQLDEGIRALVELRSLLIAHLLENRPC